ncbi:hypothetical protein KPH14_012043 [Odynerus spinipes]|uniref:Uncharacterized protein n=1 Tax=Odynerus spinipes TaxID=1348599 RepID=A0AAD9RUF4_9HYME|nr:hypothetical protein KPH14_012043 [Odynerus spinipes]
MGVAEEFMSQLMPIFESLRQKEDLPCSYPLHMHAPSYHWVRERSARSVPMGQTRASRSSLSAGTPDSLSDNEGSFRISARKTSTPYRTNLTPGGSRPSSRPASRPASRPTSRPGSRPASRQGSKPPSRYGSTQSLDSTDEAGTPSRIPRRTTIGTTGNTPTSSRHNSISGRRLGTPVNGASSRPRTPTGLVSPASGSATSRTRTPSSGSSTPLPPSLKLSRKPSGASDTSVSNATTSGTRKGKPTPIDQRAPFRL